MSGDLQRDGFAAEMRAAFDADLDRRIDRAFSVRFQNFIPGHWFAAAASECIHMYLAGQFYGAVSVSQAYVEAVSKYLIEHHSLRATKDSVKRWRRLKDAERVSVHACKAAECVLSDRNDFHHLNKSVVRDYALLESRALECVNHVHEIESEVFGYSITQSGRLQPEHPEYWPYGDENDKVQVYIRNLW